MWKMLGDLTFTHPYTIEWALFNYSIIPIRIKERDLITLLLDKNLLTKYSNRTVTLVKF